MQQAVGGPRGRQPSSGPANRGMGAPGAGGGCVRTTRIMKTDARIVGSRAAHYPSNPAQNPCRACLPETHPRPHTRRLRSLCGRGTTRVITTRNYVCRTGNRRPCSLFAPDAAALEPWDNSPCLHAPVLPQLDNCLQAVNSLVRHHEPPQARPLGFGSKLHRS